MGCILVSTYQQNPLKDLFQFKLAHSLLGLTCRGIFTYHEHGNVYLLKLICEHSQVFPSQNDLFTSEKTHFRMFG